MNNETYVIETIKINDELVLQLATKNYLSYLDYNNGTTPVRGLALESISNKGDSGVYEVTIKVTALGVDFSSQSSTEFREIGQTTSLAPPADFRLLPAPFLSLKDTTQAELEIKVTRDGQVALETSRPIDLLPIGVWRWQSGFESLVSFSVPNTQAVSDILTKARTILGNKGKDPLTKSYQWGADFASILAELEAIYEAAQTLKIQYSNPPTSYDQASQRVRTAPEIIESKSATCLDSTLLMASALEAAGYLPIIAIAPGHAFVGAWLWDRNEPLGDSGICNYADVINLIGQEIVLFETTTICAPGSVDFKDAVAQANLKVTNSVAAGPSDADRYVLVDVSHLKLVGRVKAVPDLQVSSTGEVTVIESVYQPVFSNTAELIRNENPAARQLQDDSPARFRVWKENLLDLTFRNPLLEMTRSNGLKKGGVRIFPPSQGAGAIEDLLQSRDQTGRPRSLRLIPSPISPAQLKEVAALGSVDLPEWQKELDAVFSSYGVLTTDVPAADASGNKKIFTPRLKRLLREARANIEESGVNSLYITFGSLEWPRLGSWGKTGSDTATSPLLLLPVTLTSLNRGQEFSLSLDDTNSITTNETLALKLLNDFGIDLPKLRNPDLDNSGFDVPGLIQHVKDVLAQTKHNDWIVRDDCTIGFYDFSTFHQWKDLNDNWRKLKESPLVEHLTDKSHTEFKDPATSKTENIDLDIEVSKVPIDTDESQIRAIARSLNGESFVIQGPPGTGKSQTITNLLARNLQEGRRVLFVCEKAAALEVVKRRLDSIGLGDFVLDLHGTKTRPAEVRTRLMNALELSPDVDKTGLETAKYDHDMALNSLKRYPERLHSVSKEFDTSVYDARDKYLAIDSDKKLKLTRNILRTIKGEAKLEFSNKLLSLAEDGAIAGTASRNPWSLANVTPESLELATKDEIKRVIAELSASLASASSDPDALQILQPLKSLSDIEVLANLGEGSVSGSENVELMISPHASSLFAQASRAVEDFARLGQGEFANDEALEAPIEELRQKAQELVEANLFNRGKKLEGFAFAVRPYLQTGVVITRDNYQDVLSSITAVKTAASRARDIVFELKGVIPLPPTWNPLRVQDCEWLDTEIAKASELKAFVDSVTPQAKQPIIRMLSRGGADSIAAISRFGKALRRLISLLKVDQENLDIWLNGRDFFGAINESLPEWSRNAQESDLNNLTRWAKVAAILQPLRDADQGEAYLQIVKGEINYSEVARAFERSYYELIFEKLLDDNDLGNFEGVSFDSSIKQFSVAGHKLKGYTRDSMAQEILNLRTFDGKAGVGKAGSLRAELNKRTNQLPVRQLMKRYWDTITEITPCIAASPDSVARFLDVDFAKFDVVVFDEASQIRVATAIGALGRAKSAIIVGDSKQMPPTSFFSTAIDSEEDIVDSEAELPTQDEESILSEAVRAQIPSTMLTWHYRSQDEALIAFSNQRYYDGRLSSFPGPTESLDSRGVTWHPVPQGLYFRQIKGVGFKETLDEVNKRLGKKSPFQAAKATELWNTNPIEALAIVDEVTRRYEDPELRKLSLGIVTMNEQQKALIETLLDEVKNEALQDARNSAKTEDYLFVRALEKVQGDERDVVLMSVGFSEDAKGDVPMNFGPLSRAGGERRLNVAITRARVQVGVFCSFDPAKLANKLKDSTAQGMHDLAKYLQMAQGGPRAIGLGNGGRGRQFDRHRADIARELESKGWVVQQDVGLSGFRIDITLASKEQPGQKLLGIMLDGRDWNARKTASDRDVLPVVVLQNNMKWPAIERVWLPTWMRDRAGEIDRIDQAARVVLASGGAPSRAFGIEAHESRVKEQTATEAEEAIGASTPEAPLKGQVGVDITDIPVFMEHAIVVMGSREELNNLDSQATREKIRWIAAKMTSIEGPVSPARFASVVAKSFGLTGVKSEKAAAIPLIPVRQTHQRDTEGFMFPADLAIGSYGAWSRQEIGEGRDLEDISLTEIVNAMRDLCARVHGMSEAELFKQVSLAFGRLRLGSNASSRLGKALAHGLKSGALKLEEDLVLGVSN
jgi:superfamily I DNA and/or RNA helicase